jgi:hypothetical protein
MKWTVVALWLLVALCASQSIIDFSHTEVIEKAIASKAKSIEVNIAPSSIKADYLLFPGACYLSQDLS